MINGLSSENNLIKGEIGIHLSFQDSKGGRGLVRRIREAIDPAAAAAVYAEADLLSARSMSNVASELKHAFPTLSEVSCAALAFGITQEQKKLENVLKALSEAATMIEPDAESYGNVDENFASNWIYEVGRVSDEDMRKIWARVLACEANDEWTCSRRTMRILSEMDSFEANDFSWLCAVSSIDDFGFPLRPLYASWFDNNCALDFDIAALVEMGLIEKSEPKAFMVKSDGDTDTNFRERGLPKDAVYLDGTTEYVIKTRDSVFSIELDVIGEEYRNGDRTLTPLSFPFKYCFTRCGLDLARICDVPELFGGDLSDLVDDYYSWKKRMALY